jgi:peroxiredoxin
MIAQVKNNLVSLTTLSMILLVLGLGVACRKKQPSPPPASPNSPTASAEPDALTVAMGGSRETPVSIKKMAAETKNWMPVFEPWWGKIAPDFTLTDIQGNVHTLSKYRGKNVVVFFLRTYNPTCKLELRYLKELRSSFPDGSVVILGISNEPPSVLTDFATAQGIGFAMLSAGTDLPAPFGSIEVLPTTFFIDPQGRFKLAASGVVSTEDAKTIIEAK